MIKLIGAAVILVSGTMIGWQIGRSYALRPVQLQAFLLALQTLESEIVYGATPLHRAFVKLGNRIGHAVGQIFLTAAERLLSGESQSTRECWQAALEKHWPETALRRQEKEVLLSLGHVLGHSDREDQQKHLRLAMSHLHSLEQEARQEQAKYEKMYKSLGFLGGLLVVILMM